MINEKLLGKIPNDINEIKNNIVKMQGKVLWSNSKPDVSISSNQTINLSNSSYDYLEIFYKQNTSLDICYSRKIPKGYSTRLGIDTTDGFAYRGLTRVNDAQYTINTISVNFTSSVKDSLAIPILIVGYKNS